MTTDAALRAGQMRRRYEQRLRIEGGRENAGAERTVPKFLIGAHALLQCTGLIGRDASIFRDCFKALKVFALRSS